jgi:hypothetical protein
MTVQLNTKANILEIVKDESSGILRTYLLSNNFKNKLEKIVFVANTIKEKICSNIFIEVKYPLGRRDKRIEIVSIDNSRVTLYKIVKMNDFDESYFELLSVIDDMEKQLQRVDFQINGCLVFMEEYNRDIIENFISNQGKIVSHFNIRNL